MAKRISASGSALHLTLPTHAVVISLSAVQPSVAHSVGSVERLLAIFMEEDITTATVQPRHADVVLRVVDVVLRVVGTKARSSAKVTSVTATSRLHLTVTAGLVARRVMPTTQPVEPELPKLQNHSRGPRRSPMLKLNRTSDFIVRVPFKYLSSFPKVNHNWKLNAPAGQPLLALSRAVGELD